ncbi:MAG TPA: SRPBCC family protein [Stellaceae bacterium]|nr:SRPBCC family protein [Stellaceae bacterium]
MARTAETGEGATTRPPPLKLSRVLHARRDTVFRAWTTAEHIKNWFCPETYTVPEAKIEPRAGGAFDLCMQSPAGERHWMHGSFAEIVPDSRLVIDATIADDAGRPLFQALTEVELSDALGGTRMDVTQTYTLIDAAKAWMVEGAPQGWASTLDKLEKEVVRMQGGTDSGIRSVVHAVFSLERTYDAAVARVWAAFTDAAAKEKWFAGPAARWEMLERRMDVRPGGRERLKGRWEGGVVSTFDAVYHDVIPHERLVYSYEMYLADKKISVSLATVELTADRGQTTVKVTEQGAFLDGYDDAGSREHGTGHLLEALGHSLAD